MTLEEKRGSRVLNLPEGYTARPPTLDDVEAAADLENAYMQAVVGRNSADAAELYLDWTMPGFNLADHVRLVFAADGSLAASMTKMPPMKKSINSWRMTMAT